MAKGEQVKRYLKEVKALAQGFTNFKIRVIPREDNVEDNALSKYVWHPMPLQIHCIKRVDGPNTYECFDVHNTTYWVTPISEFKEMGIEP